MYDLLIIGAGPAGLLTALRAAKLGLTSIVFEEHKTIGSPDHCAGILDLSGLKRLGLPTTNQSYIQNTVSGAFFHGYDGSVLEIGTPRPQAAIVDRQQFDAYIGDRASEKGVSLQKGERIAFSHLHRSSNYWELRSHQTNGVNKSVKGRILIISEGFSAILSRQFGFRPPRPLVPAIQVVATLQEPLETSSKVHMYFDRRYAEGFFAWITPITTNTVKIGLGAQRGSLRNNLKHFITQANLSVKEIHSTNAHCILTGGPIKKWVADHVCIVGDTAGQVKPTTGGGVNLGGLCAFQLAETAATALESGNTSSDGLIAYQQKCNTLLGKEFRSMRLARKILNSVSDMAIARLLRDIAPYQNLIAEEAEIDFQSGIIDALKMKPRLILSGIRELIKDVFRPKSLYET